VVYVISRWEPSRGARRARLVVGAGLAVAALALAGCGSAKEDTDLAPKTRPAAAPAPAPESNPDVSPADQKPPYKVSARGGLPASGPGARYNHCERIWCMTDGENFFIDHFVKGHEGWILHDSAAGDVFVPKWREGGPTFPGARAYALRLCGEHLHPYILGSGPVKAGMYTVSVGYSRAHFRLYGTSLDTCCLNGLGWDYIHSTGGRYFRFHDLDDYRNNPDRGWQKPFTNDAPH
jgi:hypothetical protein